MSPSTAAETIPCLFTGDAVTGRELEYLFSPMSVSAYLHEYWARRPLHLKGNPDKYARLFDRARFDRAVANARPSSVDAKIFVRANFARGHAPGQPRLGPFTVLPEQCPSLLAAGGTICVNWINEADPKLDTLARALKAQLGHAGPARFNAYLSPDGGGAGMHFDARIVTTMQVAGSKVWRISKKPAVAWPRQGAILDRSFRATYIYNDDHRRQLDERRRDDWEEPAAVGPEDFEDVLLEPGDLLVLPSGTWHAPQAHAGESLAINFACDPAGFDEILLGALRELTGHSAAWRCVPPFLRAADGAMPDDVKRYLAERLGEATAALGRMTPESPALVRSLGRHIVPGRTAEPSQTPALLAESDASDETVRRGDTLRLPAGRTVVGLRARDAGDAQAMTLFTDASEADVPPQLVPMVVAILDAREFRASQCEQWSALGWPSIREALEAFVAAGFLERAPTVAR